MKPRNSTLAISRRLLGWESRARLRELMKTVATRCWPYGDSFYKLVDQWTQASAPAMAASIYAEFSPQSAVDVGCGSGWLLAELRQLGCSPVQGFEASSAGLKHTRRKGIAASKLDLRQLYRPEKTYDVCCCFEVAEHLDAEYADNVIRVLTSLADVQVFSAAVPGQGGVDHRNEQPNEYWIERFAAQGFRHLADVTNRFRRNWSANPAVQDFYANNVMVFRR